MTNNPEDKIPNVLGAVAVGGVPTVAAGTLLAVNIAAGSVAMGPLIPIFAVVGVFGLILGWVTADT